MNIREKVALVVVKYGLGHKEGLRNDLGVLLEQAYNEGFNDGQETGVSLAKKKTKVVKS